MFHSFLVYKCKQAVNVLTDIDKCFNAIVQHSQTLTLELHKTHFVSLKTLTMQNIQHQIVCECGTNLNHSLS